MIHFSLFQCERQVIICATATTPPPPPQLFYGPFSGTTRVSQCQARTSGLYGAREE